MAIVARMVELLAKAMRKPPHVVAHRALAEAKRLWEAFSIPRRGSGLTFSRVLDDVGADSLDALRARILRRPYVADWTGLTCASLDELTTDETARLRDRAEAALRHEVNILGSGPIALGNEIDWHCDFKTGRRWPPGFFGEITYGDPGSASDVKVPWELSRLQWLIPAAQMYVLTGEDRYARAVRSVLEQWMTENPYGASVNWTCTMEVALRVLSWTFFYHALCGSEAWADSGFQQRLLLALYEHGNFTAGHLEFSDVNGNHYTADAAGLVFAGVFFGGRGRSRSWSERGWKILETELPRQVTADGVDFEGSVPYHRLVLELFFLPAVYRERQGLLVAAQYRERLIRMARFLAAYTPSHGIVPLLGDADDARALPLGTQSLNDHRYLLGCVAAAWNVGELRDAFSGSRAEATWLLGLSQAADLPSRAAAPACLSSVAFPRAGYYAMRSGLSHVFIDCAPVGTGGRGGHGHNDCLSFTVTLEGVPLVVDCGAYVYTASYSERNLFRSTSVHNTPQVDNQELNRFISPAHLWNLHYDAVPLVRTWSVTDDLDLFVGTHEGFRRLSSPVTPVRTIILDKQASALLVSDVLEGAGRHLTCVPWHLDARVRAELLEPGRIALIAGNRRFSVDWQGEGWSADIESARVSPSYGVVQSSSRIAWRREGEAGSPLTVLLRREGATLDAERHAATLLGRAGLRMVDHKMTHVE